MPVWHEATRKLQEEGRLQLVGITEEQHPDRCRLFMQWKELGWPVLWDPINLTGVSVVPLTWAIDEQGIVRAVNPQLETIETFVRQTYPDSPPAEPAVRPSLSELESRSDTADGARAYGDALLLYQGDLEGAISAYRSAIERNPEDGRNHFRLGVALRARFDSPAAKPGDLQAAVDEWSRALALDPNQYIWRRRIQQYGPRLEKPYPFYDWVAEARRDIRARGEEPYPLHVEPRGSELAAPAKTLTPLAAASPPDRERRVHHDPGPGGAFVDLEKASVPKTIAPGKSVRLHLLFRPNRSSHWNNEAEPLRVFVIPPEGFRVDPPMQEFPLPAAATSDELRAVEFEVAAPETAAPGRVRIPIQSFYYVCESADGTCLFRRKDDTAEIEILPAGSTSGSRN